MSKCQSCPCEICKPEPAPEPAPDLLNQLHTLRSLALDVKQLADKQHLWRIATISAQVFEEATAAIDLFNAELSEPERENL